MADTSCNHYGVSQDNCRIPRNPDTPTEIKSGSNHYVACDNEDGRTCPAARSLQSELAAISS